MMKWRLACSSLKPPSNLTCTACRTNWNTVLDSSGSHSPTTPSTGYLNSTDNAYQLHWALPRGLVAGKQSTRGRGPPAAALDMARRRV